MCQKSSDVYASKVGASPLGLADSPSSSSTSPSQRSVPAGRFGMARQAILKACSLTALGHQSSCCSHRQFEPYIEALIIRIGFWGPLYYSYNKEPPK